MRSVIKLILVLSLFFQVAQADSKHELHLINEDSLDSKQIVGLEDSSIEKVIVKGENPIVIYVPIIHDGPYNHLSTVSLANVEEILKNCKSISDLLYEQHGVKNVLLEGVSKKVAAYYNKLDGKKIKFNTKMKTWQAWSKILNSKDWNAIAASNIKLEGPLTKLGYEYSNRIVKALNKAKANGWFRDRDNFTTNQKAFQKLIAQSCAGYNDKHDAILKADPKLKNEYNITVGQRNKVFIENTLAAKGAGIIFCGVAHTNNLLAQMDEKGISYAIIVPKGVTWPVKEKTDDEKFADMLKLGCQLKECNLQFGDGTSAKIKLPIK